MQDGIHRHNFDSLSKGPYLHVEVAFFYYLNGCVSCSWWILETFKYHTLLNNVSGVHTLL